MGYSKSWKEYPWKLRPFSRTKAEESRKGRDFVGSQNSVWEENVGANLFATWIIFDIRVANKFAPTFEYAMRSVDNHPLFPKQFPPFILLTQNSSNCLRTGFGVCCLHPQL